MERISPDFKQVLKKDGKRIMGLDSQKNKTTYTRYSDAEMKLNRAQYSMKTINENQIAVMIHGWTPSVAGNYTVYHYYAGANPPKAPHPTKFRIKFAGKELGRPFVFFKVANGYRATVPWPKQYSGASDAIICYCLILKNTSTIHCNTKYITV